MKNTRIYKGRDGWQAETMSETDANGMAWQISTYKTKGGVMCYAIQGQDDGGMFSYDMFGAKRMNSLASQAGQCNEKKVREVHAAGLIEFERIIKETAPEKPAYVLGIGQIIFTDGIGDERRRVIYEVVRPGHFKTVSLDGKQLSHDDRVKPHSEKFGIGVYYNEGETMTAESVSLLVESATANEQKEATAAQERADSIAQEKAAKIAKGKLIVPAIPAGGAAAEGRFLCGEAEKEVEAATVAPVEVTPGKIQIIDYSEKAIAVIGDTRPIKEKLKSLGGRFNFRLSCGAGWIFKKSDLEVIKEALQATAQAA